MNRLKHILGCMAVASAISLAQPNNTGTVTRPPATARYRDCGDWLDPGQFSKYSLVILTELKTGSQPGKLTAEQHEQVREYLREGGHVLLHGSAPYHVCGGRRMADWLGGGYLGDDRVSDGRKIKVLDNSSPLTNHLKAGQDVTPWLMPKSYPVMTRFSKDAKNLVGREGLTHVFSLGMGKGSVTFVSKQVQDYMKPKGGYWRHDLSRILGFVEMERKAMAAGQPSAKPIALVGRKYERQTYREFFGGQLPGGPSNLLRNGSFEQAGEGEAPETWNRMGRRYVEESRPAWQLCRETPVHGKMCLRGEGGTPYRFGTEIRTGSFGVYTLSVYLKSSEPNLPCEIGLAQYESFRQIPATTEVRLSTKWQRYRLTEDLTGGRNRGRLGPLDFWIAPKGKATVWMDAMQFEKTEKPTPFSPSPRDAALAPIALRLSDRPAVPFKRAPRQAPPGEATVVQLKVSDDAGDPRGTWPVSAGIPMPKSALFDPRNVRVLTTSGTELPAQTEALSRWVKDGSIRSLLVTFNATEEKDYKLLSGISRVPKSDGEEPWVKEGEGSIRINTGPLAFGVRKEPLALLDGLTANGKGEAWVTGTDGTRYTTALGEVFDVRVERAGPVCATVVARGNHRCADGRALLDYAIRVHAFKGQGHFVIDHTFINENVQPATTIKDMALRIPAGGGSKVVVGGHGESFHATERADDETVKLLQASVDKEYSYRVWREKAEQRHPVANGAKAAGWVAALSAKATVVVAVEDMWQNHPKELVVGPNGIDVYLWPRDGVKDLVLPNAVSKTHRIRVWLAEGGIDEKEAARMGRLLCRQPLLRADPSWYCASGVWGDLLPRDEKTFPGYERLMARPEAMDGYSIQAKDSGDYYGMFNYGDSPNSSGWSNLETMDAHALFLAFIRSGGREHYDMASAAATHYRDVDIVHPLGQTCTHCSNHTFFRHNTSHSWIQGILDHYLLTGDRRSREVAIEHAEWLCETPLDAYLREGRKYTRYIDHLLDIYMTTGERRYLAMFHKKLNHRAATWEKEGKVSVLSPTGEPGTGFAIWYGCDALMKLHQLDPTPEHREMFLRELDYTIDRKRFEKRYPDRFADKSVKEEEAVALCLAGLVDNRGNTLFPPLAYAYRLTEDKRYLRIGMLALAASGLNQFYYDPLMVMRGCLLSEAKRAGSSAETEKEYEQRARDLLFANATDGIPNGGFENGTEGWSARRPFGVDAEKKCEGRQSLRVPVSDKARSVSVVPAPIRMKGSSVYTVSGYVTHQGRVRPGIVISYRDFSGLRRKVGARHTPPDPNSFYTAQIGPAKNGSQWRHWSISIETEEGGIASLRLDARQEVRGGGAVWYDGIRIERKPRP